MIRSEASASEFAINNPITASLPHHDAPRDGTRPSAAPPRGALDLAKGPPAIARRPRPMSSRTAPIFKHFPVLPDEFGFDARLVHWLIIYWCPPQIQIGPAYCRIWFCCIRAWGHLDAIRTHRNKMSNISEIGGAGESTSITSLRDASSLFTKAT